MEKLAFKEQASSFWRLAKMNSPEWVYALVGSIGSVVCGSLSAFFAYVLSAVLSVYYNQNHAYMSKEIDKYCYLLIGLSSAALLFNTLQHFFWDIVGENLTKRVREKMLTAVPKMKWHGLIRRKTRVLGLLQGWLLMQTMSDQQLETGFQ
jgi:ATP-binding cassette subfamily B (MDR/TAP) protein 1